MENISRRRFLRDASIGAATLGAAATVGQGALAKLAAAPAAKATGSAALAASSGTSSSLGAKDEVMAHVVGGPAGTIEIYSGTEVVTLHDQRVANALLAAVR